MSKMQTGRKQYKSMRGKPVDMELLRKRNELTPAVGNARVNARGDELGPGGKIVKKREEVIKEFYGKVTKDAPGHSNKTASTQALEKELTAEEQELFEDNEWVEDDDGNFVRKGE